MSAISNMTQTVNIDSKIIPTKLKDVIDMPKAMENVLLIDVDLRNKIINFAQKLKLAMNMRSQTRAGCMSKVPWTSSLTNKCITFHEKADLFYYLSIPTSNYNKMLTVATRINQNLKLQNHFNANNRTFCPRTFCSHKF